MKNAVICGALSALLISCADNGQITQPVSTAPLETGSAEQLAISKLDFLTGRWEGPGTVFRSDGSQTYYTDYEHVRFDLENSLLLINATGKNEDGEITYSLHTVIYYDAESQNYIYTPYSRTGASGSFQCKLEERPRLLCYTEDTTYRLIFQRLENGQWNEYGERLTDGDVWEKNFETILNPSPR